MQPDIKGRNIGVKYQRLRFNLLFGLKLCESILKITDNLSKTLQTETLSAAHAQHIADMTVKTLERMRSDDSFQLFFKQLETLRKTMTIEKPVFPRQRKVPKCINSGKGDSYFCSTIEEHYHRQYFEALDLAISAIH